MNQTRRFFIINLLIIFSIFIISVFANTTSTNIDLTKIEFTEYGTCKYIHMGREMELGPKETMYLKITYSAKTNEIIYIDAIRQADDYAIYRKYANGSEKLFLPLPELTAEQIENFYNKYDPIKIRDRMNKEQERYKKEREIKSKQLEEYLLKENLLKIYSGRGYELYSYLKPSNDIILDLRGTGLSGILGFNDIEEKYFDSNLESEQNTIVSIMNNILFKKGVTIVILPYNCPKYENGLSFINYTNNYTIVLFNNKTKLESQLKTQLKDLK